jgi:hypothetical protein
MQRWTVVLMYFGIQCIIFPKFGWECWFPTSFYLKSCAWPDAISQWIRQRMRITFRAYLGKIVTKILAMVRQAFGEERVSRTSVSEWRRSASLRPSRARQVKSNVKNVLIILCDVKGTTEKKFVLTGQRANSANNDGDFRRLHENVGRIRPEIWRENNWLLHHDNGLSHTSFHTKEFLTK